MLIAGRGDRKVFAVHCSLSLCGKAQVHRRGQKGKGVWKGVGEAGTGGRWEEAGMAGNGASGGR